MCNQNELSIHISSDELTKAVKVKQIRAYVLKQNKELIFKDPTNLVIKPFKSEQAVNHVKAVIDEFLNNMCESLNSDIATACSDLYNCCDCGSGHCGCGYCFSCNACSECLSDDE